MTTLVQVDLRSDNAVMTCWVDLRVRVGDAITLKSSDEPDRLWSVTRVGDRRPATSIKRGWHNNY